MEVFGNRGLKGAFSWSACGRAQVIPRDSLQDPSPGLGSLGFALQDLPMFRKVLCSDSVNKQAPSGYCRGDVRSVWGSEMDRECAGQCIVADSSSSTALCFQKRNKRLGDPYGKSPKFRSGKRQMGYMLYRAIARRHGSRDASREKDSCCLGFVLGLLKPPNPRDYRAPG